jgi:hypothetical protein
VAGGPLLCEYEAGSPEVQGTSLPGRARLHTARVGDNPCAASPASEQA